MRTLTFALVTVVATSHAAAAQVTGQVSETTPSAFSSSAIHLDFDSLLSGTTVTTQFQNVGVVIGGPITFTSTNVNPPQTVTAETVGLVISEELLQARTNSPPNAVAGFCVHGCETIGSAKAPIPISFVAPVTR